VTKLFISFLSALLLAGCGSVADPTSWFDDDVKEVVPNELTEFEQTLKVKTLWDADIGAGTDNLRLRLIPRVDNGRVYAADSKGQVQAFDSLTGRRLWGVNLDLPLSGGPGSGEGLVLLGTTDGEVVALDADNGQQLWKAQVSSEVLSVPATASGVVVVHSIDGKLAGLSAVDGKRLWLYSLKVPVLTLRGTSSPVINGGIVYAGFDGGKLSALDLQKGFVQWEVSITAPSGRSELERMVDIDGDPFISDGNVYVATYQGELAAVSEYSGTLLWRRKLSSYTGIAADWRNIYISDDTGTVWGISPENGAAMWKQDKLLNRGVSAPAVINGYVVVGDYQGYLHWLSHDDGRMVARTRVGSSAITAAPVMRDGVVYVFGDGGALAAVQPIQ
jgi:outer membrane protein assembly factor BamB